jgi:hypothetical protein
LVPDEQVDEDSASQAPVQATSFEVLETSTTTFVEPDGGSGTVVGPAERATVEQARAMTREGRREYIFGSWWRWEGRRGKQSAEGKFILSEILSPPRLAPRDCLQILCN